LAGIWSCLAGPGWSLLVEEPLWQPRPFEVGEASQGEALGEPVGVVREILLALGFGGGLELLVHEVDDPILRNLVRGVELEASTDNPLKQLVSAFPTDFASWLLNAPVVDATPHNVELPADSLSIDQLYDVGLEDGRHVLLHLEFQGRGSREPMPLRMLAYRARLMTRHQRDIMSVVIYVGQGAGADDTGVYTVHGPSGEVNLLWR
jgi:hypothetical protein